MFLKHVHYFTGCSFGGGRRHGLALYAVVAVESHRGSVGGRPEQEMLLLHLLKRLSVRLGLAGHADRDLRAGPLTAGRAARARNLVGLVRRRGTRRDARVHCGVGDGRELAEARRRGRRGVQREALPVGAVVVVVGLKFAGAVAITC